MCATAFTADTIIHSTSTLFLRPSEYPLLTQNTNKKRCVRTETALETLMVKSEEKKKVIDFYFVGLLGRSTFGRSAALLVAQTRVCV